MNGITTAGASTSLQETLVHRPTAYDRGKHDTFGLLYSIPEKLALLLATTHEESARGTRGNIQQTAKELVGYIA